MNDNPVISVILPTHNRARILARSMRSVLAQSFRALELIVVDDASTDHTAEVVDQFDDPRVIYKRLSENSGAAVARNTGARLARGAYLAFQDSDDEWLLDKLTLQVDGLRESNADLLCCGYLSVRADGAPLARLPDSRMVAGEWGADNIYDFCFITPTWLITRDAFMAQGGFDESMPNLEDWELSFRLFKTNCKIRVLNDLLMVKHRGGSDSLNWKMQPRIDSMRRIIEQHRDVWRRHHPSYARLTDELGRLELRAGQMANGRKHLWRAICLQPSWRKPWLHLLASFTGHRIYMGLRRH